jgi:hypothetical protein
VRVDASIEIERPLPEVFRYVADVGNYPAWMAHALDVRKETPDAPHAGDTFTVALESMGRRFETPYTRTSYEDRRGYTDQAVGGPISGHRWESGFQEVPAGTRVTRAVEVEPTGVLKLLAPLQSWTAERQLKKDLETLKGVLESR